MGHVRDWLTHHDGTRTGALRTVAGAVCGVDAVVVALAPSLSPPVADQWLLHLGFAVALVLEGVLVLATRRASDEWGVLAAVTLPTVTLLALLACTHQVGTLAALLLWPALATPLFPRRATVWAHLALLATGLAGVVLLAPDPRVSWFTWVAVMAAAISCAVTVRVIAEHSDEIVVRLSDRAVRDTLTGLLNRRAFDEHLDGLWSAGGPVAVAFFDLDHFKVVNDTYGHPVGDGVLAAFASVLRGHVRDGDVVARTGGEEFGLVMPGRAVTTVLERAQAVVDAFSATRVPAGDLVLRCTVSAGVAIREPRHTGASHLCRDADRALYRAKEGGRNQAILHADASVAQG